MMEVQQLPPPLPPKSRRLVESTMSRSENDGNTLPSKAIIIQPKMVNKVHPTVASHCKPAPMNDKKVTTKKATDVQTSASPPRDDLVVLKQLSTSVPAADDDVSPSRIVNLKKSLSLNNRKSTLASAFSEPVKTRVDSGFRIITWGEKDREEKPSRRDEEFLYQNVSNTGTNYLEYKLKHMINNSPGKKNSMKEVRAEKSKNSNKDKTTVQVQEKSDQEASQSWSPPTNKQIQVHQVKNKTVVKISINNSVPPQDKDIYFKPVCNDDFSTSEYQYPELIFKNNSMTKKDNVNEYAEPYRGDISKASKLYANVDLSKKRKKSTDGLIYENSDVVTNDNRQVYMNVTNGSPVIGQVYANLENDSKIEHHYLNLSTTLDSEDMPEESQVYQNEDFTVLKNSQVTQSVIEKNPLPVREDVYENTEFISMNNVMNNIKFSGPGMTESSGYQTPKSSLRLVVNNKEDLIIHNKKFNYDLRISDQQTPVDDGQYSPSDTFDSGTSSDLENSAPTASKTKGGKVIVTVNQQSERGHKRAASVTSSGVGIDSEVSDTESSNISCDSLNSNDIQALSVSEDHGYHTPTSEHKAASPVEGIEYQNIDVKNVTPDPPKSLPPSHKSEMPFKIHDIPDSSDTTDIIQQVANAAERMKSLRVESAGLYLAKRVESFEEIYENFTAFEPPPTPSLIIPPAPSLPIEEEKIDVNDDHDDNDKIKALPKGLLRDIRSRNVRLMSTYPNGIKSNDSQCQLPQSIVKVFQREECKSVKEQKLMDKRVVVKEQTYEERKTEKIRGLEIDTDKFYKFHLYENAMDCPPEKSSMDDETFAGLKDYLNRERPAAITSAKGTIRGVKNRVKAGIATFLQLQESKTYKDKDAGKIVIYSTTMGIVRETYQKCLKVKQILRTLMVKFEDRDVFMSTEAQDEIRERMKCKAILVPQVFVEGQHIGDAETIERLNETGELRKILKPYKSLDACSTCNVCGGYRLLPCRVCKGSKKSIHRNNFTTDFVSLKCMNCDPVGLMKCYAC